MHDQQQAQYHTEETTSLSWMIAKLLLTIDCSQAKEQDPQLDEVICEALLSDRNYKSLWITE